MNIQFQYSKDRIPACAGMTGWGATFRRIKMMKFTNSKNRHCERRRSNPVPKAPFWIATSGCAFLAMTILILFTYSAQAQETKKESAYDRVMKSETIKCGYFIWPPFMEIDINTQEKSGVFYDITEEIGKQLSLKIEWSSEISWDSLFEGYKTGKYDAICGPMFSTPSRARESDFTTEIAYAPTYLYSRADDTRFDNNYEAANDESVKISILEGEYGQILANEIFPKAQKVTAMNLVDGSSQFMDVASSKSDVVLAEPILIDIFMQNNPGKLKRVSGSAIRLNPIKISVTPDEYRLTRMLDIALENLHDNGFIDKTFNKYLSKELDFPRVSKGYEVSE